MIELVTELLCCWILFSDDSNDSYYINKNVVKKEYLLSENIKRD